VTGQQQQLPPGQDEHTIKMNAWFIACFDNRMVEHTARIDDIVETLGESFPTIEKQFEEIGEVCGQYDNKILELLDIVKQLAVGKDFLSGRIDQITRDYRAQLGITQQKSVETVATIEEERTTRTSSKVQQVVRTIDEILAN
jgi:hypothetical protein